MPIKLSIRRLDNGFYQLLVEVGDALVDIGIYTSRFEALTAARNCKLIKPKE